MITALGITAVVTVLALTLRFLHRIAELPPQGPPMTTQPKRRPQARELITANSERILAGRYAGQVRAVVIERALTRMDEADARRERAGTRREGRPS